MNIEQLTTKEIGINLKYIRERKRLSVKEVCGALKISPKTYYNYEHGAREPSLNMLIQLANFFNCSLDDLASNSVGGKIDATISFESFKIEEGNVKRRARTKVTTLPDNIILAHDGLNVLTFLRSDTLVSGETMLFKFKKREKSRRYPIRRRKRENEKRFKPCLYFYNQTITFNISTINYFSRNSYII